LYGTDLPQLLFVFLPFSSHCATKNISFIIYVKVFPVSAMKSCREVEVKVDSFLTLALDGGDWLASRLDHFSTGKGFLCPLDRRLCGLQSQSGRFGEQKNLLPLTGIRNPRRSARSLVSAPTFNYIFRRFRKIAKNDY
jgi:hypothetical protein